MMAVNINLSCMDAQMLAVATELCQRVVSQETWRALYLFIKLFGLFRCPIVEEINSNANH